MILRCIWHMYLIVSVTIGNGIICYIKQNYGATDLWVRDPMLYQPVLCPNNYNNATGSPEISREQVQKLTPQFLLYIYWK